MRKKVFALAILAIFPLLTACGEALPASSDGVVENDPIELEWDRTYEGTLKGDQPFMMSVPDSSILTFDIESTEGIVTYRVLSGSRQLAGDNVSIRQSRSFSIILDNESGGEFELLIRGFDAAYKLKVSQTLQNDGGIGGDADGDLENGVLINDNGVYTGDLGVNDTDDAYLIPVPANGLFSLTITNPETSERAFSSSIFIGDEEIFKPDPSTPGDTTKFVSSFSEETIYGFALTSTGAGYSFEVDISPANDGGSGGDAGDSLPSAAPMQVGIPVVGHLSSGDTDCFSFSLDVPGEYALTSVNAPASLNVFRGSFTVFLRNADSRLLKINQLVRYDESITSKEEIPTGNYFLCVVNDSPLALYEITFDVFVEK